MRNEFLLQLQRFLSNLGTRIENVFVRVETHHQLFVCFFIEAKFLFIFSFIVSLSPELHFMENVKKEKILFGGGGKRGSLASLQNNGLFTSAAATGPHPFDIFILPKKERKKEKTCGRAVEHITHNSFFFFSFFSGGGL